MISEIARFSLILALIISVGQSILPLIGAARRDARLMAFGDFAAPAQFLFIALAMACLVQAFVTSDFSLAVVAGNSHTDKPLLYRIVGVWGNHEGSMLLWVLILALFGATIAFVGSTIPSTLKARVLSIQGMIGTGFLAFVLFTSNPFVHLFPVPVQGQDLNPLLQDPGLASHPPCLYLGYVGFSTAFSFAVAALIEGRADYAWASYARPWVLAAWTFLTLGIMLGSLWAYYELGWGGFWFWDPVENASLMPWLLGTALLHSMLVVERRQALEKWTVLLSILTFSMSLVGTFVVRSGVLTSVHAFAIDPERGIFILGLLIGATGGALMLYALRMPKLGGGGEFESVSREGSLVLNNVLLITATATVFIGTFYPLLVDLMGKDKISVGPPYYALTFVPLALPLLMTLPAGPLLRWRSDTIVALLRKTGLGLALAVVAAIAALALLGWRFLLSALGAGLAIWLIAGAALLIVRRAKLGELPLDKSVRLLFQLPRTTYAVTLAHFGVGLLVAGILGTTAWKSERVVAMRPGQSISFAGYDVQMGSITVDRGPNYESTGAMFEAQRGSRTIRLMPVRRYYPARRSETTEAAIHTGLSSNLYIALGEQNTAGAWTVRFYHHPLAIWIWLGPALMAAGGALSWSEALPRLAIRRRALVKAGAAA